jgi:hypothetical protein
VTVNTPIRDGNLVQLYLSGDVRRWHQNPVMSCLPQNDADHVGRSVQILLWLNPATTTAMVRFMSFHDVGELLAGDLSSDFKRDNPVLAKAMAEFEKKCRESICGTDPVLSIEELRWIKLVDSVEACCYTLLHKPLEAQRLMSGWPRQRADTLAEAAKLGAFDEVLHLFSSLEGGRW